MFSQLEESNYLYLLLLLPVLVALFVYIQLWKVRKQKEFGSAELVNKLSPEKSVFKPLLKLIVVLTAIVFLIIGITNPFFKTNKSKTKVEGIDVVFTVDVSKSMLAEDVVPNRLEKSKQLVSQIISNLKNDRVGIIAYSGSAFPLLPITTDYNVAKMFLQNLNSGMISSQGSSLDEAINLSADFFKGSKNKDKLMIMITDGEDHSEQSESAAESAKNMGLKIITIGVGTIKGANIPNKQNGVTESYHRDKKTGEIVITKLRPEVLSVIAQKTNGIYLDGTNTGQVLKSVKEVIANTKKNEYDYSNSENYDSQFQWFLGIGFLLLFLDVFFLEIKTKWVQKLDLFNEKNKK